MDFKNLRIRGMEDRHKLSIMVFLYENGRSMKSTIYENISTNARMVDKIEELEKLGLLTIDQRKFENNATFVELTELGKSVAKKISSIEKLMSGDFLNEDDGDFLVSTEKQRID